MKATPGKRRLIRAREHKRANVLPQLQGIQQQIMTSIMNSIAYRNYGDCCSVEELGKQLHRTPGRMLPIVQKLVAKGYLTLRGQMFQWVYPTVAALRQQDTTLSDNEAKQILSDVEK